MDTKEWCSVVFFMSYGIIGHPPIWLMDSSRIDDLASVLSHWICYWQGHSSIGLGYLIAERGYRT